MSSKTTLKGGKNNYIILKKQDIASEKRLKIIKQGYNCLFKFISKHRTQKKWLTYRIMSMCQAKLLNKKAM